jgi:hypothetical protein
MSFVSYLRVSTAKQPGRPAPISSTHNIPAVDSHMQVELKRDLADGAIEARSLSARPAC